MIRKGRGGKGREAGIRERIVDRKGGNMEEREDEGKNGRGEKKR